MIVPVFDILRIQSFPVSAKYTVPSRPTATPLGLSRVALVAEPPSPVKPFVPVPIITIKAIKKIFKSIDRKSIMNDDYDVYRESTA